ncbi:MAG: hypothetical protein E7388_02390 [Ruminococcaceae bacterium]|nr:hypothetical protein [Oscillospiraceae bacterium]
MGILRRFKNLFSGMCHGTADKLENSNPQWLIAHVEENIRKTRKKATTQLIEIQTWTEMIRLDMQEAENELFLVQEQIDMAVQKGDKELLAGLLLKQDDCKNYFESKKNLFDSAVKEALRIRDNYHKFEAEMNEKSRLLKNIKSQARLVEIRSHILKLEEFYGADSQLNDSMDKLRFAVNQQSARIMATEQLNREGITARVADMEYSVKWENAMERATALLEKG